MNELENEVQETTEEVKQEEKVEYPYVVSVKFHSTGKAYSFGCFDKNIEQGGWVVVETSQGIELGECVSEPLSTKLFPTHTALKPVLRIATEEDKKNYAENIELADVAFKQCQEEIKELSLDMNLLSAEYSLDRSKVLFVYLADQRVDFRELLKRLSSKLHCRIELRQIGERDKAKMVGGIGMCGMECCCSRYKTHFDVISINMAKNQLMALNVEKLSGMCGKLMCCLKYEDDNYKELTAGLPKMGANVEYEGAIYRVTSMNVMRNEARLENSETVQMITIDDLKANAAVRKGIAGNRNNQRNAKRQTINTTNHAEQKLPAQNTQAKLRETILAQAKDMTAMDDVNPLSLAAKPAFKAQQSQKKKGNDSTKNLEERNAKKNGTTVQNHRNHQKQQNSSNHKQRANQQNGKSPMPDAKKPNVTVRSFKAKKTQESSKGE